MSKPLGGIASLKLGVASSTGAAPTLEESGTNIPLLEDRSTYTEKVEWVGATQCVEHTLTLYTSFQYTLPEELLGALSQGFVALIEFNSGDTTTVGWSTEALADRALQLMSCTIVGGEKPLSRGYKEWVFSSTDGAQCTLEATSVDSSGDIFIDI